MAAFTTAAQDLIARSLAREGTLADYRRLLGHAQPVLGGLQVERITRQDVEKALALAAVGLAPKSLRNLLGFIRQVLRDSGNPCTDGMRVSVPDPDVRAMNQDEVERWKAALPGDCYGEALLVLLRTGLRVSELLGLRPQDWDARQLQLHVVRQADGSATKSGRQRRVDVPDDVVCFIQRRCTAGGRVLFPEVEARTLRRRMAETCQRAGLHHFRVHALRHTRCTQLLLSGAPPIYVADQAGHSSPAFTQRVYGHLCVASQSQRRQWCST